MFWIEKKVLKVFSTPSFAYEWEGKSGRRKERRDEERYLEVKVD